MNREEVIKHRDKLAVGLDDSFRFRCQQCGDCCRHRRDILLSPTDICRMAKALDLVPPEFLKQYCIAYIGDSSRLPVVRLASIGQDDHCPLLKDNKCIVHNAKPAVCAMYPLGRHLSIHMDDPLENDPSTYKVQYLLQPYSCNDGAQRHTVRDWLQGFNFDLEAEGYKYWNVYVIKLSRLMIKLEKHFHADTCKTLWDFLLVMLYQNYDCEAEILPQLKENVGRCYELLSKYAAPL